MAEQERAVEAIGNSVDQQEWMHVRFVDGPEQHAQNVARRRENIGPLGLRFKALSDGETERGIAEGEAERISDAAAVIIADESGLAVGKLAQYRCRAGLIFRGPV